MSGVTVALFGGSFNPPHVGHVLAVAYALSVGLVERVLVVPVFEHALGKRLAPFPHRLAMSERAFAWLPGVEVSRIEEHLGAPSRTLRTIQALEVEHPEWRLRLLVGSDITGELEKWHAFHEIARRAPPLILPRAGASEAGGPPLLPEVSSTRVRQLLQAASRSSAPLDPTSAEPSEARQLASLVPTPVWKDCAVKAVPATGATQSAVCLGLNGPEEVELSIYPSAAALDAAYEQARKAANVGKDFGGCSGTVWGGEGAWLHGPDKPGGKDFCYFDGNDAVIVWTHEKLGQDTHTDMLGTATVGSSDHAGLFRWWRFWHHQMGKLVEQ